MISKLSPQWRGIFCIVLGCLCFVVGDSCMKLMMRELAPLQTLAFRGIWATISCLVLLFALGLQRQIPRALNKWSMLRALAETIGVIAFMYGLAKLPIADLAAIFQTAPFMVIAGASIIWGEHIGWRRWLLILAGMVGAVIVAQPGGSAASPYAILGIVTALLVAGRDLLSRFVPADIPGPVSTLTVVVMVMLAGFVGSLAIDDWAPINGQIIVYSLIAGVLVMLGHLFLFLAFRFASARTVAPFYYSTVLFAVMSGILVFGEWPTVWTFVGTGMIVFCGIGVLLLEGKKEET